MTLDDGTMSSFLMNSGSYDPKLFGAEADYHSQSAMAASAGYMGHAAAATSDAYYHQAAAAASIPGYPGYAGSQMAQLASNQHAAAYGRDAMGYSNFYQNYSPHHQQMLQQQMASGGHLSPLGNPASVSVSGHLSGGGGQPRSPVASPQPQNSGPPPNLVNNVLNHQGGGPGSNSLDGNGNGNSGGGGGGGSSGGTPVGGGGPPTDDYGSPQGGLVPQPQLTPGGNDGISSDCSDDESSPQSNRQMPVVYPWMKKIHVGGQVGKMLFRNFIQM